MRCRPAWPTLASNRCQPSTATHDFHTCFFELARGLGHTVCTLFFQLAMGVGELPLALNSSPLFVGNMDTCKRERSGAAIVNKSGNLTRSHPNDLQPSDSTELCFPSIVDISALCHRGSCGCAGRSGRRLKQIPNIFFITGLTAQHVTHTHTHKQLQQQWQTERSHWQGSPCKASKLKELELCKSIGICRLRHELCD